MSGRGLCPGGVGGFYGICVFLVSLILLFILDFFVHCFVMHSLFVNYFFPFLFVFQRNAAKR